MQSCSIERRSIQHGSLPLATPLISEQPVLIPTPSSAPSTHQDPDASQRLALTLAEAADDRKGGNILLLNVQTVSYLTDYFVLVTGFSRTQVRAIADAMQQAAVERCHRAPAHIEGQSEANWIVLDYGDAIAHIMVPDIREFYNLEAFWGHAERLSFPLPPGVAPQNIGPK